MGYCNYFFILELKCNYFEKKKINQLKISVTVVTEKKMIGILLKGKTLSNI